MRSNLLKESLNDAGNYLPKGDLYFLMYVHDLFDLFEFNLFDLTSTHIGSYHIWLQRPVRSVLCSLHWPNPKTRLTTTPQLVCYPLQHLLLHRTFGSEKSY